MPTPERKPNIFNTPRFSGKEKTTLKRDIAHVLREAQEIDHNGVPTGIFRDISILAYYIDHNVKAAQAGVSLEMMRESVLDLQVKLAEYKAAHFSGPVSASLN